MTPYVLVLFVILCTAICYLVANNRGANVPYWVVMGAVFGPFAIPFVFFSRPRRDRSDLTRRRGASK